MASAVMAAVAARAGKNSDGSLTEPAPLERKMTFPMRLGKGFFRYQQQAKWFYTHPRVQYSIAGLIFANFFANIIEKQADPFGVNYPDEFLLIEDIFNYIFLIELIVNAYAHWWTPFRSDAWNQFDVLVVFVGVLSILRVDLPGPFSLLRMLRAFRVFRLFKRIKSLQKIIVSLIKAVPGMLNAGFIMVLVMCIYAILAVEYFGEHGNTYVNETGEYVYMNMDGENVTAMTARGLYYGDEYFGTFLRSLFTLFQVLTGESWAEAVARPVLFGRNEIAASIFFVSFVLVNSFVLINVVVAVLLEKCLDSGGDDDAEGDEVVEGEGTEGGEGKPAAAVSSTKAGGEQQPAATAEEVAELRAQMGEMLQALRQLQVDVAQMRDGY